MQISPGFCPYWLWAPWFSAWTERITISVLCPKKNRRCRSSCWRFCPELVCHFLIWFLHYNLCWAGQWRKWHKYRQMMWVFHFCICLWTGCCEKIPEKLNYKYRNDRTVCYFNWKEYVSNEHDYFWGPKWFPTHSEKSTWDDGYTWF